jgi:hypothetical protein
MQLQDERIEQQRLKAVVLEMTMHDYRPLAKNYNHFVQFVTVLEGPTEASLTALLHDHQPASQWNNYNSGACGKMLSQPAGTSLWFCPLLRARSKTT